MSFGGPPSWSRSRFGATRRKAGRPGTALRGRRRPSSGLAPVKFFKRRGYITSNGRPRSPRASTRRRSSPRSSPPSPSATIPSAWCRATSASTGRLSSASLRVGRGILGRPGGGHGQGRRQGAEAPSRAVRKSIQDDQEFPPTTRLKRWPRKSAAAGTKAMIARETRKNPQVSVSGYLDGVDAADFSACFASFVASAGDTRISVHNGEHSFI